MSLEWLLGSVAVIVSYAVWLTWWLGKQFAHQQSAFFERISKLQTVLLDKLEYHERHDDVRFNAVNNELWAIKIRNASRDGVPIKQDRVA